MLYSLLLDSMVSFFRLCKPSSWSLCFNALWEEKCHTCGKCANVTFFVKWNVAVNATFDLYGYKRGWPNLTGCPETRWYTPPCSVRDRVFVYITTSLEHSLFRCQRVRHVCYCLLLDLIKLHNDQKLNSQELYWALREGSHNTRCSFGQWGWCWEGWSWGGQIELAERALTSESTPASSPWCGGRGEPLNNPPVVSCHNKAGWQCAESEELLLYKLCTETSGGICLETWCQSIQQIHPIRLTN